MGPLSNYVEDCEENANLSDHSTSLISVSGKEHDLKNKCMCFNRRCQKKPKIIYLEEQQIKIKIQIFIPDNCGQQVHKTLFCCFVAIN